MSTLKTTLASRREIAPAIVDFTFAMKDPGRLAFRPGQFVTLLLGTDSDGQVLKRSYSVASSPGPATGPGAGADHLRLILRLVPGGAASAILADLEPGAEVAMTGPHGFFMLDAAHAGDVVFAATGTGIAPVLPMLAELGARPGVTEGGSTGPGRGRRLVFWGLRNEADLFAADEVRAACAAAGAELLIHLSQPGPGWTGATGRITAPILDLAPRLDRPVFYLVGNGAMIAELKKGLQALGVDRKRQIRTESFFG